MSTTQRPVSNRSTSLRYQKSVVNKRLRTRPVSSLCHTSGIRPFTNPSLPGPSTLDTIGAPTAKKSSPSPPPPTAEETQSAYLQQLAEVPELEPYGPVLHSSAKPVQLTESETEYQVSCVKHIFKEHVVFQVNYIYILRHVRANSHCCHISSMYRIPYQTPSSSRCLSSCSRLQILV